jgi:hypothetical protein
MKRNPRDYDSHFISGPTGHEKFWELNDVYCLWGHPIRPEPATTSVEFAYSRIKFLQIS